ncbi:hypothetical protein CSC79_15590 [Pseudoalteromonas sp. 3D05]|nr:hypothetical protein CSC79_15590 [Pseudoalteromonas sp. 3D05]
MNVSKKLAKYKLYDGCLCYSSFHHSQRPDETNSNYGFSVIWWDKLFGSYKPHASETDATLKVGLSQYSASKKNASVITLLLMPFK